MRTCLTLRRGRGRRRRHEDTADEATIAEQARDTRADQPGLAIDLERMLATLGEEDRALVILKYAENYSYEELAEIFGLSTSACKMRVSRAREKIQQEFGDAM